MSILVRKSVTTPLPTRCILTITSFKNEILYKIISQGIRSQMFNYQTVVLLVYCSQNRVEIVKGKKWQLLQLWTDVSSLHICLPQRSWTTLDRITTGSQA